MSKTISIRIYLSIIFLSVYISNYRDKHTPSNLFSLSDDGGGSGKHKMFSCFGTGCQDKWNLNELNRTKKRQRHQANERVNERINVWEEIENERQRVKAYPKMLHSKICRHTLFMAFKQIENKFWFSHKLNRGLRKQELWQNNCRLSIL